jgi:hypothetical protein
MYFLEGLQILGEAFGSAIYNQPSADNRPTAPAAEVDAHIGHDKADARRLNSFNKP